MDYKTAARVWLDEHGPAGQMIAQRERGDQYVVVLDTGPKIHIPLSVLDALDIPDPEATVPTPEPPPAPKRKRRSRRKTDG